MNRRDKQREETYAEILRTGEELFVTKGYEHTSIQQIADACGLTKGALYHHFDSKEALLEQICKSHHEYLLAAARPHMERKEVHWFARIGLILAAIREANEARQAVAGEYLKARRGASGQLGQHLARYEKEFYLEVIAPVLAEARERKEASFAGSAETLSVFIYSLDKAMTDEMADLLAGAHAGRGGSFEKRATDILETFVHSLSALLGIQKEMVLEVVRIPETIAFMTGMLAGKKE